MTIYDTAIIGGGVVGLSILRSSLLAGYNAILFERNPDLCDGASGRNSGVICTGVDAPSGSLERALIRDSISRVREFCMEHNVPMRECGSLVCLWPWDNAECDGDGVNGDEQKTDHAEDDNSMESSKSDNTPCHHKLRRVLRDSHIAGDKDALFLNSEAVSRLEPSLSKKCIGAVHVPGEIVVDPWLFPLALAAHSRELAKNSDHECDFDDVIQTGREVVMGSSSYDAKKGLWSIVTRGTASDEENDTVLITTRSVVNAAGIDSDLVQWSASSVGGEFDHVNCALPPPNFEARPRRGQYIVYSAPKEGNHLAAEEQSSNSEWSRVPRTIPTRPIQPVPTDRTKGIFVFSTLYDQIVVGPTARDQLSRTDSSLDANVSRVLSDHASRVLGRRMSSLKYDSHPDFDFTVVGEYVGIRTGTSKRDYQIHLHFPAKFITVGGIRSTGLTASLGIGRHVVQCLLCSLVPQPEPPLNKLMTPLPDVKELVEQYHSRGDGTIVVEGHMYKVTHPLTRMGWDARTGLAE